MHKEGSLLLSDYASEIAATDVLSPTDFNPVLQGLYGEVGGIMSTVKNMSGKNLRTRFQKGGGRRIR